MAVCTNVQNYFSSKGACALFNIIKLQDIAKKYTKYTAGDGSLQPIEVNHPPQVRVSIAKSENRPSERVSGST
ncbi:hypothetical protein JOD55_001752 [Arcanobacterium pluranimalium]|nr:hypothetical protein [Arcanobacterium pluranimalium]